MSSTLTHAEITLPESYVETVIPETEWQILNELRKDRESNGDGLTQPMIQDELSKSIGQISTLLNKLERHGLVTRYRPEGETKVRFKLTESSVFH